MKFRFRELALKGVYEIVPKKIGDSRGFFSETYQAEDFAAAGIPITFVQDNHSFSEAAGVMRGLHYQIEPHAQDKLVRVVRGAILDVVVDIRRSSPNFGKWVSLIVSAEKWNQILVPKGFAHGLVTLEPKTEIVYKASAFYSPQHDRSIRFDDPQIGIDWTPHAGPFQLSDKDERAPYLRDAELFE